MNAPADMCDCPVPLVNLWNRDGEWVMATELTADPAAVDVDADLYSALGCDGFVIMCPQCGTVYAMGATIRG